MEITIFFLKNNIKILIENLKNQMKLLTILVSITIFNISSFNSLKLYIRI